MLMFVASPPPYTHTQPVFLKLFQCLFVCELLCAVVAFRKACPSPACWVIESSPSAGQASSVAVNKTGGLMRVPGAGHAQGSSGKAPGRLMWGGGQPFVHPAPQLFQDQHRLPVLAGTSGPSMLASWGRMVPHVPQAQGWWVLELKGAAGNC